MIGNRQCWDEIATLYAVRGEDWEGKKYWERGPLGDLEFTIRHIPNPSNKEKDTAVDATFRTDPNGNRAYIVQVAGNQETADMIETLMTSAGSVADVQGE